jgi:two-component system, OmpR family, phosphate regulon sensor histidine kinase PhoR
MWQDLGSVARHVVLPALALAVLLAVGVEWGWFSGSIFALLGLAVVLAVPSHVVLGRLLAAEARVAVGALGPDAAVPTTPPRRLSPGGWAIWPAALRLDRAWREHAAAVETRLAAAEAIIAAAPDPLIAIDRQRRILQANAAAAEFIGPGGEPRDLAAALRNPLLLAAADAVLAGEGSRSVEFTVSVPVERVLRAQIAAIAGGKDRPAQGGAAAILSLHDVTELKRSEQMRADFVANAGHELKTPLAALIGFIETLRGPARDDADARERFLAIMGGQATRMTRLVEDLLSLSRIELNEHVLPQGRVALAPLLGHLAEALELRAGERDMRIVLSLPPDLPDIQGDRDELAQVFQNLFDNAIKYGRWGTEISVGADTSRPPAAIGGRGPSGFVAVAIRDRGEGIAREHLPRLTERFYRVDTARSREMGGTGLGLAIVKHIVNRHRGFLEIDSTQGEGSVLTVFLRQYAGRSPEAVATP